MESRNAPRIGMADAVGVVVALTALAVWRALPDGVNHPKMLVLILGSLAILPFAIRRHIQRWRANPGFGPSRIVLAAGVLLPAWAVVSALLSDATWQDSIFGAWGRNVGLLTLFSVATLLLAAATFTRVDIERFISWMIVLAAAEVVIGAMQLLGTSPVPGNARPGQVIGTFGNTNFAAGYFAIIICLIATRALARHTSVFQRWLSVVLIAALAVLMVGTGATQAIGAGLAGIAAFLVAFAIAYRGRFRRAGLIGAGALAGAAVVGTIASVLGLGPLARLWADSGFTIRLEYWRASLATFEALPIFGTGPDGLKRIMGEYRPESYVVLLGEQNKLDAAHNILLQFAATIGVVGAVAWLVLMVGSLALLTHRLIRGPIASPALAAGLAGSFVAYLVQGMVSIDMLPLVSIGWVLAGVAVAYSSADVSGDVALADEDTTTRKRRRPGAAAASIDIDYRASSSRSLIAAVVASAVLVVASGLLLSQYMRVASNTTGTLDPDYARVALTDPMVTCQARNGIAQAAVATLPAEEIVDTIEQATAIDPRCGFMIHFQSELAINTRDLELAEQSTLKGITYDPLLPVSWVLRGLLQTVEGDLDGARTSLAEAERVASLSPAEGAAEGQIAVLRGQIEARAGAGS